MLRDGLARFATGIRFEDLPATISKDGGDGPRGLGNVQPASNERAL